MQCDRLSKKSVDSAEEQARAINWNDCRLFILTGSFRVWQGKFEIERWQAAKMPRLDFT
jgi:hypothetical protein